MIATRRARRVVPRPGDASSTTSTGARLMLQGVMLDITSRKRAEDELELRYVVQKKLAEAASLNEGLHGVLAHGRRAVRLEAWAPSGPSTSMRTRCA